MRAFLLCGMCACTASAAVHSFNWDIENKTGLDAKDFHLTILSDKPLTNTGSFNGAFGAPTIEKKAGGLVYDISWAGGTVAKDGKTHVGVSFDGEKGAKLSVLNVRWTGGDNRQIGTADQQPTFPGWKVAAGFMPAFNVARNDDNPDTDDVDESTINRNMLIQNARFAIFSSEVPLDQMQAGLLSGPSEAPFNVVTDGEYSGPYDTISTLPTEGFLVTEFTASFVGADGEISSTCIMQSEIPSPAGALAMGLFGAVLSVPRRRQRLS